MEPATERMGRRRREKATENEKEREDGFFNETRKMKKGGKGGNPRDIVHTVG